MTGDASDPDYAQRKSRPERRLINFLSAVALSVVFASVFFSFSLGCVFSRRLRLCFSFFAQRFQLIKFSCTDLIEEFGDFDLGLGFFFGGLVNDVDALRLKLGFFV